MSKMQTSTASPESNTSSTSSITKSKDQILIQSESLPMMHFITVSRIDVVFFLPGSGAMIAVIVIGIIVILAILLFILKTYNKRTHASRLLGSNGGSKPRKKTPQSPVPVMPMANVEVGSMSGHVPNSNPGSEPWPRAGLSAADRVEEFSTASGSTAITIHDSSGNT
ncbi:noncompact myelin-associated protein isoform X1 [Vanacampus margaritifer]